MIQCKLYQKLLRFEMWPERLHSDMFIGEILAAYLNSLP